MSLTDQSIELPEPSQKPSAEQSLKSEEPRAEIIEAMEQQPANPPTLKLPTDRPRPAVQSFHGATRHFNLSSGLTGKLNTLSRHENVSLFITLLAAFHTLLHRYSGQDDIMTGTPARRDTLALRTDLSNNPGFRDLLVQVGANANQDIPLKPVETLHPQRDRSGNPLFQVMFELKNSLDNRRPLNEARAGFLQADSETILFDLGLELSEAADGLTGRLKYATDLFDVSTIDRLIGHFQTLLEGIVTQPEARLSELPLLTEAERRQLLVNWNDTAASFPDDKCIHELFEAQAAATPQAVAVIHEQNRITYAELNAQANRLAHHLCGLGVKPDTRVAICAERNLNMVVGLLAILKAGGAYVPLDPAYPKERLEFMLEDCSPLALLTQGRFESLFAGITSDLKVIDLEAEHPPWANRPGTNPDRSQQGLDPKHLAYVIYTSGSTGTPKGVMIEHRGLCNMITDLRNRYRIRAEDRILQFVAIAFDVSVQDIFSALLSGAALVLRSDEWIANAGKFWALCEQNKVSIVTLPTLFWQQLAQDEQAVIPATIRQIIIGGEAVNNKVLAAWFERKSYRPKLFNEYGPTETTVNATIYQPLADSLSWQSIGRPIANMRVYILDACRQPVPIGLTGELYIAGAGVARGYLNRPDLTAERFIADPFTTEAEARMYKTGDLARWLADGTLEFVGRNDFQVKIRGFRIELGDIEAKLAEHPAVRQAAVSAHEDREGFKHLVAYVVLQDDFTPDIAELRDFLKRKMPEFMLPSAFMFPAALPVTPNGKLDRKALPVPDMSHRLQHDGFIAPRSPMEELIAGIWSEILSVAAIGSQDNFFEQGGDSLLALQFISRFRERLALEIPLRTLFDLPTVTELAAHLESRLLTGEPAQLPAISRSPRVGALPPSFAQMQMWLLERISGASRVYNLPFSLRLKQVKDQGRALERALNEIIRRHEALRTCLAEQEGSPFQLILPALPVNLLKADLRNISEELREIEIGRQIQADTAAAFELNQAPLFRAKLIRLGAEEYLFFIVFHHIIFDAWSKEVFARELSALYGAFSQGLPSPLPELPIQYADYAVRQREWLQGEPLNRLSAYWKARLANASTLELPTDRPRPAVQSFRGATQQFNLPSDLTGKLKTLSRHEGVTLFMTLAAAFQLLLHRYSGQDDIVIGTPVAGRSRLELEGLIGFFVNTLVLRADLSGNPSFRELLAQVREVTLGAYAHQDMPFEKLVEALNPQRDRSRNPLFQVMFTLQNIPDDKRPLNQMTAETLQFDSGTAKFDLTFELSETPQGLTGGVEYATDLFEAATISRLIGHFQTLLEGIAARPEARLSDLPLLTEAERRQLLTDWNDTAVSFPEHRCIHELFEAQAAATPQAPALVYEQSRLGYAELNAQANRLAH
ncbi:MAG: amino acid adenylation domain-containing protein, partial [Methylococcaceae bacterium]